MDDASIPERFLLGALIVSPVDRDRVLAVIGPSDFADPWHQDVAAVLTEHPAADLVDLARWLRRRIGPARADVPRLHTLVHDLPLTVDADAWARLVLEASLRRQVAQAAVLVEACRAVEATGPDQVRALTSTVRDLLAAIGERSARAQGRDIPGVPVAAARGDAVHEQLLGADRLLAGVEPIDVAEVREVEVRFIGSLLSHPDRILSWADHIRPEWLTATQWAPVLAVVQRRAELGETLDVVSVCWETARTARPGRWPGFEAVNAAAEDWCWLDPDPLGRQVARQLLVRGAVNGAASIRAAAHNPAVTLPDLLDTAE